ncbi:phosphate-starvation-inducible PsiE family protein [uncultured Shewanella sp.]|uniref:phosphate-starvation-inducible PsiE family protein n=1 Tax=Shewanella atlantica TaxID=271099 RepID=UPI0026049F5E|nr:phosphate-starvation-inducible PsiE family protein [uncultured Shewanella sp.]
MVDERIDKAVSLMRTVKKFMTFSVLIAMYIVVGISIFELAIALYADIFDSASGAMHIEIDKLLKIFGFFFIILIGFELIETIEMYFKENVIHAEIILLVAVIAVSRKVILLDLEKYEPLSIVGLGLIIFALGGCYALIKVSYRGKNV